MATSAAAAETTTGYSFLRRNLQSSCESVRCPAFFTGNSCPSSSCPGNLECERCVENTEGCLEHCIVNDEICPGGGYYKCVAPNGGSGGNDTPEICTPVGDPCSAANCSDCCSGEWDRVDGVKTCAELI